MEHTRKLSQSGSWMDTLKLAASIRTLPSEWVPHTAQVAQEQPEWFPVLKPASPSRGPSPSRAPKRYRSEGSIKLDNVEYRAEPSDYNFSKEAFGTPPAMHSPLTSRGSMNSLDELACPPPPAQHTFQQAEYQPLARNLLFAASQNFSSHATYNAMQQKEQGSLGSLTDLTSALYSLLHDDAPNIESLLKAMLKAKLSQAVADGLQDSDFHHLRQIQNLVWDMQAEEEGKGENETAHTSPGPALSECCSASPGQKRKRGELLGPGPVIDFDLNL